MLECNYSFDNLYEEAFGRKMSVNKKKEFQTLPQEAINILVNKWAKLASWKTSLKIGRDGKEYLSFHP